MIILDEFIWRTDHYAFHLTNDNSMKKICVEGLKPLCGERSQSVNDNFNGIFFFDNIESVSRWIDVLYENKDIYELELLRFNLKNRKWIKKNDDEFYLIHKVLPKKIEYLRLYDNEKNVFLPLNSIDSIDKQKILTWNSLEYYKPLKK